MMLLSSEDRTQHPTRNQLDAVHPIRHRWTSAANGRQREPDTLRCQAMRD